MVPSDDHSAGAAPSGTGPRLVGARAPNAVLQQALDETIANIVLHRFLWGGRAPSLRGNARDGQGRRLEGELESFYGPVPEAVDLNSCRLHRGQTRWHDVCDVVFPTPMRSAFPENDRVWLRHWTARRARRRVVLGLDGLVQVGSFWFGRLAELLGPHGIDVVMMDEPFDFRRTPRGYRPGQLIVGGDLWHQLAVLRQGVRDGWCTLRSLRQQGYEVGVVGLSFGGLLALLLSLVVPELRFAIALVPPADPAGLLRHPGQVTRALKRGIAASEVEPRALWQALRPVRPILWRPAVAPERIDLHAARWDRFVPGEPTRASCRRLENAVYLARSRPRCPQSGPSCVSHRGRDRYRVVLSPRGVGESANPSHRVLHGTKGALFSEWLG